MENANEDLNIKSEGADRNAYLQLASRTKSRGFSGRSASVNEIVQSQSLRRYEQKIKPSSISPDSHLTYQRRTSKAIEPRQCPKKARRIGIVIDFAMYAAFDNGDNIR